MGLECGENLQGAVSRLAVSRLSGGYVRKRGEITRIFDAHTLTTREYAGVILTLCAKCTVGAFSKTVRSERYAQVSRVFERFRLRLCAVANTHATLYSSSRVSATASSSNAACENSSIMMIDERRGRGIDCEAGRRAAVQPL